MKKAYMVFAVLLALLLCLSSCNSTDHDLKKTDPSATASSETDSEGNDSGTGETPDLPQNALLSWNRAFSGTYESVKLVITTTTEGISLTSVYDIQGDRVSYSVEQLRLLPSTGDAGSIPEDGRMVLEGTAEMRNGQLYSLNGDAVELPEYDMLCGKFSFKEEYFSNMTDTGETLVADVQSASEFLGFQAGVTDLKVTAEKQRDVPKCLELVCQTEASFVRIRYEFN